MSSSTTFPTNSKSILSNPRLFSSSIQVSILGGEGISTGRALTFCEGAGFLVAFLKEISQTCSDFHPRYFMGDQHELHKLIGSQNLSSLPCMFTQVNDIMSTGNPLGLYKVATAPFVIRNGSSMTHSTLVKHVFQSTIQPALQG